jgi:hypothetical protein
MDKNSTLKELQIIPGIGKACSQDLWNLGIRSVSALRGKSPERLYARFCRLQGGPVDRCMLYTLRCAVYFAETKKPDPQKLLWWNWKD